MQLNTLFDFNKKNYYIPLIFIFLTIFYLFQYNSVKENLGFELWEKILNLKTGKNLSYSLKKLNPKPLQFVLENIKKESKCSDPFISVSDKGRLGNKICEFIALYFIKLEFGIRAVVSSAMYSRLNKLFETVPVPHLPNSCFQTETKSKYIDDFEKVYEFFKNNVIHKENILNSTNISHYTFISRIPCPLEKAMSYKDEFRSSLKFKKENIKTANDTIKDVLKTKNLDRTKIILVGAHIRRSDYIRYTRKRNLQYPSLEYYQNAFNFFRKMCGNVTFIVVSDDIIWCKKKLSAPDVIIAGNGDIGNPEVDYTLLTLCDHHIRGLGTFGLTSAFLGTGSAVIFRRRNVNEKPILTLNQLSKFNFTCDSSSSHFYIVDE